MHRSEGDRGDQRFGEVELWVGTTGLGVVDVAATVLTLAAAFFLDFPEARIGLL